MRQGCDFSNARKNPCAAQLKKPLTKRRDEGSISQFKGIAEETGVLFEMHRRGRRRAAGG